MSSKVVLSAPRIIKRLIHEESELLYMTLVPTALKVPHKKLELPLTQTPSILGISMTTYF